MLNVLENQTFLSGSVDTNFIDEQPTLFNFQPSQNRAQKLLNYIGSVLVNGPSTPLANTQLKPANVTPHVPEIPIGELYFHYILPRLSFLGLLQLFRDHGYPILFFFFLISTLLQCAQRAEALLRALKST